MSSLIRREPERSVGSLARAMDRLFGESLARPGNAFDREAVPAMDMYETENDLVVEVSVPGVNPENINIDVTGDLLTIKGESKEEKESSDRNYHFREHRFGSFSRTLSLPVPIDVDETKAEFANGVLTLTAPKAKEARRKTIAVNTK